MPTKIDFIGGNTKRCLMAMALPMIAAMFLNMMYNLVDSLWIGNLLGETAYAALTNSTPIILILTSVAMGATNGVSILISQAIGAKNKEKTESLISTSFCVAVVFSLLVTILLEAFLPGILKALNTPAETYDMAYSYLAIYILGYLAVYFYLYFIRCFEELWQFYVSSRSHAGVNNFERDPRSYFYPLHRISRCGDCYLAFSSDLSGVHVDLSEKEEIVCIQNLCV